MAAAPRALAAAQPCTTLPRAAARPPPPLRAERQQRRPGRQQQQQQSQQQHRRARGPAPPRATPGLGDEELDVAVFRFTLGIPGFDDANIPRVVGAAVAALVAVNHALGADPAPPAQVRAEFLDVLLAVLCFAAPELEARLREAGPGRGRAGAGQVAGAAQLFALAEGQSEAARKELAWASFALLKNVNACSVVLLQPERGAALLARGALAAAAVAGGDAAVALAHVGADARDGGAGGLLQGGQQQRWLPDRGAMRAAGVAGWACVPEGAQSALVQAVPGGALLLVLGERPRALSDKDQRWVAALAAKLGGVLAA
ncbi:CCB2 [Scenedesmus sp. PABB004]|nr:CCB2 [Scenedesmus sp. PABB004]